MEDGITLEEPNGVEEVAIDIDESVVAMQRSLHENRDGIRLRGRSSAGPKEQFHRVPMKQFHFHRVPHSLITLIHIHPTAFQPELVSIGPYHYHRGKNELLEFERYKWLFLDSLLSRTKRRDVTGLLEAAKQLEDDTRKCYDDLDIPMSSSDFVKMMVLDGCFIIELFRHLFRNEDVIGTADPILSMPWLIPIFTRDLLKLENQLPFFVLQRLFDLTSADAVGDPLALLALKFFNLSLPRPNGEVLKAVTKYAWDRSHLLDLFQWSFQYRPFMHNTEPIPPLLAFPQPLPEQSLLRKNNVITQVCYLSWIKPPAGSFKLNVDGSRSSNGLIGAGDVIRDCNGIWCNGFMHNIGSGEVLLAEAWGLANGLKLAVESNVSHLLVESDSAILINLLQNSCLDLHPLGPYCSTANAL